MDLNDNILKNDICSICQEEILKNEKELSCGHSFHKKCINTWLDENNTCPNCRKLNIDTRFKCKCCKSQICQKICVLITFVIVLGLFIFMLNILINTHSNIDCSKTYLNKELCLKNNNCFWIDNSNNPSEGNSKFNISLRIGLYNSSIFSNLLSISRAFTLEASILL